MWQRRNRPLQLFLIAITTANIILSITIITIVIIMAALANIIIVYLQIRYLTRCKWPQVAAA